MNRTDIRVEYLLPHRDSMKLIDEILEVDEEKAVARSVVTDRWPFVDVKSVNPMVLIELVAQTAGISNSWEGIKKHGENFQRKGWLVGIKHARFFGGTLFINTQIITRAENLFKFENYREIMGTAKINSDIVAEVILQLVQSDSS